MFNLKFKNAMSILDKEIEYANHMADTYAMAYEIEPGNPKISMQHDYWRGRRDALIDLKEKMTSK